MSLFAGQVWQDLNANGLQDLGELGLEGIAVYLDLNGNQLLDTDEPQRLTDAAGAYSFDNLDNGLYSIRLLSPSNTTLILPQVQTPAISLRGLDADGRGVALWDALAGAPEPERTGHDIVFNGAVIDSAYYYLASRDYLNPTAPAGIQGQGEIIGFTEFAAALDAQGYTAADLTVQFGLASLGADLEGQDWFAEGTRETRFYQGGELTLQLAGQDFLRAAFPTLTALINYNDPLNLDDDRLSAWSAGFTLEDNSLGSSPEVQAVAQAFLSNAASQGDLRLVFDSFQSADQLEFNDNGREGAVFDAQFGQLGFVEDVDVQEDGYFIVLDGDKTLDSLDFGLAPLATAGQAPTFQTPQTNPFGLSNVGFSAAPIFADIDGDGDLDAFVGSGDGNTLFFENSGSAFIPLFGTSQINPFGLTDVGFRATPTFADIDGDGDLDAFVGNNDGNTLFFENSGSAFIPLFGTSQTNPFGLTDVGLRAAPTLADIDDDGDLDAFVGNSTGDFYDFTGKTVFFENTGSASSPAFGTSQTNPFGLTDVGYSAVPTFADIDGDGDLDAFVGDDDGKTVFFENTGSASSPAFAAPVTNAFELIDVGLNSAPTFADIDGDGDLDAFVGERNGNTLFFLNAPTPGVSLSAELIQVTEGGATATYTVVLDSAPTADVTVTLNPGNQLTVDQTALTFTPANFNIPQTVTVGAVDDPIGEGPHQRVITATVTSTDANYDGVTVANVAAQITDNDIPGDPTFQAPQTNSFGLSDVGYSATPTFADIDGDGDLDAFVSERYGNVLFFENTGSVSSPSFGTFQTNPFGLTNVALYATPTFADIDGDGDLDAFVGDDEGNTLFFENTGTSSSPAFGTAQTNPFGLTDVGTFAAPTLADIDGDGDLDAFIGNGDGNTLFFENSGSAFIPSFGTAQTNPFGLTDVGGSAKPTFADIDGDGDLDAFVGDSAGNTLFFENSGSASTPAFSAPQTNSFGLTNVLSFAAPTLADIDGDGDLDAFVGELYGNTLFFLNEAPGVGATISGAVLKDLDGDGLGDLGIGAVQVELFDALGSGPLAVTFTDAVGNYSFFLPSGQDSGSYIVRQTNLAGYSDVSDSDGGDPNEITVTLTPGENNSGNDFIDEQLGEISGQVFEDIDGDGFGDLGLAGVTVTLLQNGGIVVASAVTDSNGGYLFSGLTGGTYAVQQTNLLGYSDVSDSDGGDPNEITVTLTPGQINSGNDFIDEQLGEINGQAFEDIDGDGLGDLGLAGVTVTLLQNGGIVASAVTDSNGGYLFSGLAGGTYAVQQTNLLGYFDVSDSDGGDPNEITVTLTPGQINSGNDFIDEQLGEISGQVFEDIDGDGLGDLGLAGVTVLLLQNGAIVTSAVTDSNGGYVFSGLATGIYAVQQTNLSGYSDVSDSDGGDPNEITVTLAPGQINSGNDFVDEQLGEISGQVFEDIDGDGLGDLGLAGVTVTLLQNGAIVTSAVTDSNGGYVFSGLAAGTYAVQQINLSGYFDVSDSDGGDLNLITVNLAPGGNSEANDFIDALIPIYEQYSFIYTYPADSTTYGADTYSGSVYALEGTYTPGQVLTLSGVPGTYTIVEILATTTDDALDGVVTLTEYADNSTGFGTTADLSGAGSGGLGSESGLVIAATPFNPFQEADLGFGAITIFDNFGDNADQSIRFTTPLSQFRSNYEDSEFVRPNRPDTNFDVPNSTNDIIGKYFDIVNSGNGILRVSNITLTVNEPEVNASDVRFDLDFSGGDILLNPGASQRVNLTYEPSAAGKNLSGVLTVFSDAQNNSAIGITLLGRSTFNADINYDGVVNVADLGALNQAKSQEILLGAFDPTADINGDGALTVQGDINGWRTEKGFSL